MAENSPERSHRLDSVIKLLGGLVTAVTVAVVGIIGTIALERRQAFDAQVLERRQAIDTNVRLYAQLMSQREGAETSLRKDMFNSIIGSFLTPKATGYEQQILNLELLAFNFHEALDLAPLFKHVYTGIHDSKKRDAKDHLGRLERAAIEVKRKQIAALEGAGGKLDATIDFEEFRKKPGALTVIEGDLQTLRGTNEPLDAELGKTNFKVEVLSVDHERKEIRVNLEVRTPRKKAPGAKEKEADFLHSDFSISAFDFPMIDNTRLPHGQRCAIVLRGFTKFSAEITLVYFPGSRASLKEKPFYDEVMNELMSTPRRADALTQQEGSINSHIANQANEEIEVTTSKQPIARATAVSLLLLLLQSTLSL